MANDDRNEFYVEQAVPVSTEQALVTGHVVAGRFRTGEWISFVSTSGMPLMVEISRLGSAESPLNVIREGQTSSIVVDVEPECITAGAVLLAAGDDDSNMTTKFLEDLDLRSMGESELALRQRLNSIEEQIDEGDYHGAHGMLVKCLEECGDSAGAHRLLARVYLESRGNLHSVEKSHEHIQLAWENDGAHDAAVWETLAHVLAADGQLDQGLRFLERLYAKSSDLEAVDYYKGEILKFRARYDLPDVWEVLNEYGELVFETKDFGQLTQAAEKGRFPGDAVCRKNRCGELTDLDELLIGTKSAKKRARAEGDGSSLANAAIGAVAGLAAGIVIGELSGISMAIAASVCGLMGAGAGATFFGRAEKRAG